MSTTAPQPSPHTAGRVLVVVAIIGLALNLRPAAVSVGPLLEEIRAGLGMGGAAAGVLTSLPVVAFAVFGALAPRLADRLGPHRVVALSLALVVVGLATRARVEGIPAFLALSLLALAGMATANVVLPSLVKLHFPDRVGLLTATYSTALAVGITATSVLTVPVSDAAGGWRDGLAVWGGLALVGLLPWLALLRRDRGHTARRAEAPAGIGVGRVLRTRLGRLMALFFALQSVQAYSVFGYAATVYRDAGFDAHEAGLLLGVVTGIGIPLSFVVPALAARLTDLRPLVLALAVGFPVGYLGLVVAPVSWAVVWALVLGASLCTFPLVLVLIGLRARTPAGTSALSGATQSAGYLIAAPGPFLVGLLHDVSGGWTVPLLCLALLAIPLALIGFRVSRPAFIEDELATLPPTTS